jgi:hypothetical protein
MMGNRAIYHDGWVACTTPPVPPWSPSGAEADVILNSARRQGLQEFARVLPNIKHADGGRGDARRLNKEWTNVIWAGTLIENQARHD